MARGAISVQITGEYNNADVKRAINDMQLLQKHSDTASAGVGRLGVAGVAMGAALGAAALQAVQEGARMAIQFGVDGVQAFLADDAAAQSLAQTFEQLGVSAQAVGIEDFLAGLERTAAVADDFTRPALDRLVRSTGDVGQAQALLGIALDISAKKHISLESASNALGKAVDGNYGALGRLGIGYNSTELKAMGFSGVVDALSSKFAGSATASAETYQGTIAKLGIQFGNIQEAFGRGFFQGVTDSMGSAKNAGDQLMPVMESLQAVAFSLGQTIGSLSGNVGQFVSVLKIWFANVRWMYNAIDLVIRAVVALALVIKGDFEGARKTLVDGFYSATKTLDALGVAFTDLTTGTVDGIPVTKAAADAADGLTFSLTRQAAIVAKLGNVSGASALRYQALADSLGSDATSSAAQNLADYFGKAEKKVKDFASGAGSAAASVDQLSAAQQRLHDRITTGLSGVQAAITAFQTYRDSIAAGIFAGFDFSAALEQVKASGANLIDTIVAQAGKASSFGKKMAGLLSAGLNRATFDQVVALGAERGTDVADAFINGNQAENIRRVNDAALGALTVADEMGKQSATAFMQVGVDMAVKMVKALIDVLGPKGKGRGALQKMMDDLAASMNRVVNVVTVYSSTGSGGGGATAAVSSDTGPAASMSSGGSNFIYIPGQGDVYIPGLAGGGPVMGGSPYLVGEHGPELFVPRSSGTIVPNGAGGNTYNISVSAGVGDPRQIGQQVVEYIKKFEQANGPVFAAA